MSKNDWTCMELARNVNDNYDYILQIYGKNYVTYMIFYGQKIKQVFSI